MNKQEYIDGLKKMDLSNSILELKRRLKRPKDLVDIKAIETFRLGKINNE